MEKWGEASIPERDSIKMGLGRMGEKPKLSYEMMWHGAWWWPWTLVDCTQDKISRSERSFERHWYESKVWCLSVRHLPQMSLYIIYIYITKLVTQHDSRNVKLFLHHMWSRESELIILSLLMLRSYKINIYIYFSYETVSYILFLFFII